MQGSGLVLVLGITVCAGCASVSIERVTGGSPADGLRFYRPEPYLLVSSDGKNGGAQVIYLPNLAQEYVLRPHAFLAKQELNVKLQDGWNLIEYGHTSDTAPADTLKALSGPLATVLKAGPAGETMPPGLYRFVYEHGSIVGLKPISIPTPSSHP